MNPLRTCIWFNDQAQEAAQLYCSLFKNAEITASNPIVTNFHIDEIQFMGLNGGPHFSVNPSISLFVKSPSREHVQATWNALVEGGSILMDLGEYPWSNYYGWLQDKYGVTWQIMLHDFVVAQHTVTPCMLFTNTVFGKAEEALEFYAKMFGSLEYTVKQHYGEETPHAGKLLFADCSIHNNPLIAMDGPDTHHFTFNEGVSFVIPCNTQEEIDFYWNTLTANGGSESRCGWCKDTYGVSWQVVPTQMAELMNAPEKAQKVSAAFMTMNKLDLATLIEAADSIS